VNIFIDVCVLNDGSRECMDLRKRMSWEGGGSKTMRRFIISVPLVF
jgi:hypothetical protein